MRIMFMGTPEFSVPVLKGLIKNYDVVCVVTQEDKPVGRGGKVKFCPIKEVALENGIECFQPSRLRDDVDKIKEINPDMIVTCAYGQILTKDILDIPKYGCINVHASLLPKLRGGAPIHHAIIDGYDKTGVTIMYMAEGMDNGDIISQKEIKIDDADTVCILHDKLSLIGRDLLLETIPKIIDGTNDRIVQDESLVTYGYNIKREEEKIDFSKTKREVYNLIRGLNSFPGAYSVLDGKVIKVYSSRISDNVFPDKVNGEIVGIYKDGFGVKVADGEVIITEVKPFGKRMMSARDYINGLHEDISGKVFDVK